MEIISTRNLKNIGDIIDIVLGHEFIVVHRKAGLVEVYDPEFNLTCHKYFTNIDKVNANSRVILIRKNGSVDFYDRWLNFEFTRQSIS